MNENIDRGLVEVMPAEQATDLAALKAASGPAPGTPPAPVTEPGAPGVDLATEIKALVLAFVAIAGPMLPSLKTIYTEESTGAAAEVVASLCNKHGWAQGGLMGDYGEEIAAAIVLLPLGFATVQGVKGDLETQRHKQRQRNAAAVVMPPADDAPPLAPSGSVQGWQPSIVPPGQNANS